MKNIKAVTYSKLSSGSEPRFVIVDADTGKLLDDCRGHGYKSAAKALSCYSWKCQTKNMRYH